MIKTLRRRLSAAPDVFVRTLARFRSPRLLLSLCYRSLSFECKQRCHSRFAKIFRNDKGFFQAGTWREAFLGRELVVPLAGSDPWLEWDIALSVCGHEAETLRTYASILRSPRRPHLFFDIGANYGLHSLLFLSQGVPTVSFEPNPACHAVFRRLCAANRLDGYCQIVPLALGAEEGRFELGFPEKETWLGTLVARNRERFAGKADVKRIVVYQTTLDLMCRSRGLYPSLLKIDTEGNELHVLKGGEELLREHGPLIIFESFKQHSGHEAVFDYLCAAGYRIYGLPWQAGSAAGDLSKQEYMGSSGSNFIAVKA